MSLVEIVSPAKPARSGRRPPRALGLLALTAASLWLWGLGLHALRALLPLA
jgi:hypothetical protein